MLISKYPGLKKAALEIAYDNGMINRLETEESFLKSLDYTLGAEGVYHEDLQTWSNWLETLSEETLNELCCGDEEAIAKIIKEAPKGELLNGLLNDIFEVRP